MRTVDVYEVEASLSVLLEEVERGGEITIVRNGISIARLTRAEPQHARQPGLLINDPAWRNFAHDQAIFTPLSDDDLCKEGWM